HGRPLRRRRPPGPVAGRAVRRGAHADRPDHPRAVRTGPESRHRGETVVVKAEFFVWVSGEPASVTGSIARALELELAGSGATVVLATERASAAALAGRPVVEVV